MLNYSWIPMALDIIPTWIPRGLFIITVIMVNTKWLHNNGTLKVLVQFVVKKDIFYFVHKCLRRWLVSDEFCPSLFRIMSKEEMGFLFNFSEARKTKDVSLVLPRHWIQTRVKDDFQEERALVNDEIYKLRVIKQTRIHKLWFRIWNNLWIVYFFSSCKKQTWLKEISGGSKKTVYL